MSSEVRFVGMTQFRFSLKITTVIRSGVVVVVVVVDKIPLPPHSRAGRGYLLSKQAGPFGKPTSSIATSCTTVSRDTNCTAILCLCLLAGAMRAVRSRSRCNALRFRRGTARGKPTRGKERKKERSKQIPHQPPPPPPPPAISRFCFHTTLSAS